MLIKLHRKYLNILIIHYLELYFLVHFNLVILNNLLDLGIVNFIMLLGMISIRIDVYIISILSSFMFFLDFIKDDTDYTRNLNINYKMYLKMHIDQLLHIHI